MVSYNLSKLGYKTLVIDFRPPGKHHAALLKPRRVASLPWQRSTSL
nr:AAA family ATPase [Limosilactobacillus mucosae]